jgi:hypothetical protein
MPDHDPPHSETDPRDQSHNPAPSAPSSLPAYVRNPIKRQSATRLRALADWATRLADWKDRDAERALDDPPDPDAGEMIDEETVDAGDIDHEDIPSDASVNVYAYKVPCGPGCDGCPHGPYRWGKWRDGDTVRTIYLGKPSLSTHD